MKLKCLEKNFFPDCPLDKTLEPRGKGECKVKLKKCNLLHRYASELEVPVYHEAKLRYKRFEYNRQPLVPIRSIQPIL